MRSLTERWEHTVLRNARLPNDVDAPKALLLEARAQLAERDIEIEQLKAQIDIQTDSVRQQVGEVGPADRAA